MDFLYNLLKNFDLCLHCLVDGAAPQLHTQNTLPGGLMFALIPTDVIPRVLG